MYRTISGKIGILAYIIGLHQRITPNIGQTLLVPDIFGQAEHAVDDLVLGKRVTGDAILDLSQQKGCVQAYHTPLTLGTNSIEKFWLEFFNLKNHLSFGMRKNPDNKKKFQKGSLDRSQNQNGI